MSRVLTEATLENQKDLYAVKWGLLKPEEVRRITIKYALVVSGAAALSLPTRLIRELGLTKVGSRRVSTSLGIGEVDLYGFVRMTIQGRDCPMDALEVPDSMPTQIGQLLLEGLDFVIDPKGCLIGNPAHGGEYIIDMF